MSTLLANTIKFAENQYALRHIVSLYSKADCDLCCKFAQERMKLVFQKHFHFIS